MAKKIVTSFFTQAEQVLQEAEAAKSAPKRSEIRRDYIQDKYVIIAPTRTKRPGARQLVLEAIPQNGEKCVFCPEAVNKREDTIYRSPSSKRWKVAVIPNIYPSIALDNPRAYGEQEIVIETSEAASQTEDFNEAHISKILKIYADRTKKISQNKNIQYILIFKNRGGKAGATISHAHSQIFATSFIPPQIVDKAVRAREFRAKTGKCVYCEVSRIEKGGPRFVAEKLGVIAFCPYASVHNYEVWIMPKRHLDNITNLSLTERLGMAYLLKKVLGKINALGLSYNYYFHQVVSDRDQHLYLKVTPRGSVWAGVEIGSGLIINPVAPEDAAKHYRG